MNKKLDAFLDWFSALDLVPRVMWVFAGVSLGFWLATCAGCEAPATYALDAGTDLVRAEALTPDLGPDRPGSGGSLPIGYYQLQCQWDACGGPLPDRDHEEQP
jgi:hypothetical protein